MTVVFTRFGIEKSLRSSTSKMIYGSNLDLVMIHLVMVHLKDSF